MSKHQAWLCQRCVCGRVLLHLWRKCVNAHGWRDGCGVSARILLSGRDEFACALCQRHVRCGKRENAIVRLHDMHCGQLLCRAGIVCAERAVLCGVLLPERSVAADSSCVHLSRWFLLRFWSGYCCFLRGRLLPGLDWPVRVQHLSNRVILWQLGRVCSDDLSGWALLSSTNIIVDSISVSCWHIRPEYRSGKQQPVHPLHCWQLLCDCWAFGGER